MLGILTAHVETRRS